MDCRNCSEKRRSVQESEKIRTNEKIRTSLQKKLNRMAAAAEAANMLVNSLHGADHADIIIIKSVADLTNELGAFLTEWENHLSVQPKDEREWVIPPSGRCSMKGLPFKHVQTQYERVTDTLSFCRSSLHPVIAGLQEYDLDYHDCVRPVVAVEVMLNAVISALEEIRLYLVKGSES